MNDNNRLFVDSGVTKPLPPIYKGKNVKIYPGILSKNTTSGKGGKNRKRHGLRRYVFRYEGDKFVYLATRKGQRNGGNTASSAQTQIILKLNAGINIFVDSYALSYQGLNESNEQVYASGPSRVRYSNTLNRWQLEVPSTPGPGFTVRAYSEVTTNTLPNSGSRNQIGWTYVAAGLPGGSTELPATVTFDTKQYYNNNSIENLNKWPIRNTDMNYGKFPTTLYKWQNISTGAIVPENRPECITDDLLFQCFEGIYLEHYSTVFIEVMWTYFENIKPQNYSSFAMIDNDSNDTFHKQEWWSPKPFYQKRQKGRIYRIGILDKDNGVNKTDKVLFAQRTRVVTTKYFKGGNTALD
jgi:hypothetical protein